MTQKLTDSVAREVLRLYHDQTEVAEIADLLNLKKMQVTAIIAHSHVATDLHESPSSNHVQDIGADEIESQPAVELSRSALVEQYSSPETSVSESPVSQTEGEEAEEEQQGIFIGKDKDYGDALYWNPESTAAVQNPHMMIVGESGSGKTYAVQCLTAELAQREIPAIIFDYGQGFELETLDPIFQKYVDVREYRIGEEGIALNPLQIFAKDIK